MKARKKQPTKKLYMVEVSMQSLNGQDSTALIMPVEATSMAEVRKKYSLKKIIRRIQLRVRVRRNMQSNGRTKEPLCMLYIEKPVFPLEPIQP